VVLGTVGYMSPEQVRGEPAEATSDIFSFGSVLYEMLSGKRAFKRDTAAETMTAVLREDPPELTESGFHGPPGLERMVARCLEKDPQQRFQSASDLAFGIESLSGSGSSSGIGQSGALAPVAKKRSWLRAAMWPAVALAVVAAGVGGWLAAAKMLEHTAPEFTQLTFQRGYIANARFTKDGASVIYDGQFDNDPLEIYSVRIGVLQPVKVDIPSAALFAVSTGDEMAVGTAPDYGVNYLMGTLSVVPVSGGAPRPLLKSVSSASYTEDGKEMAATQCTGGKCTLEFPLGKKLYESNGYLDGARVSPDGKSVGFLEHPLPGDDRGWVAVVDTAGKVRRLTEQLESVQGLAWTPDGKEVWYTAAMTGMSKTLYGVTMAGKVRTILGMPTAARLRDVGPNGRVLIAQEENAATISAVDATGKETPHLELYDGSVLGDISPDGKAILFSEVGGSVGSLYRVVYRKTDGSPPLTLGSGASPRLSPDGQTVAAFELKTPPEVVLYSIGAGETRTLPLKNLVPMRGLVWFPDGKHLALMGVEAGKEGRSYVLDLGSGELKPLGPDGFRVRAVAHDGRRIAGSIAGKAVIFDRETQKVEPAPGIAATDYDYRWTRDDRGLLVQVRTAGEVVVYRVDVATGKRTLLKTIEEKDRAGLMEEYILLAEDEKSYATMRAVLKDTLWMAEGVK
jgi:Tol biopolymer transport system component